MKNELRRTVGNERKMMGVCGGLGKFFGIDPTLVRVAFVCLGIWGPGIILYIACGLIIPEDDGMIRADYKVKTDNNVNNNTNSEMKSDGTGKNGWN